MADDDKVIPFPDGGRAEALRRIRQAAALESPVLDLGDLGLDALPPEIGELTNLRHLSLGRSRPAVDAGRVEWHLDVARPKPALTDLRPLAGIGTLESLDLSGAARLSDLTPLSHLAALKRLFLYGCLKVDTLVPLVPLTGLISLRASGLSVADLAPLKRLTRLEDLKLADCGSDGDLGPLAGLNSLRFLHLHRCGPVGDLAPLAGLGSLRSLVLQDCPDVVDAGPLAALGDLDELKLLGFDGLADFSFLSHLRQLTRLALGWCPRLADLSPTAGLRQLEHLDLHHCTRVRDLGPLRGLTELVELNLSGCTGVTSLAPLAALPRLNKVWVGGVTLGLPDYLAESGEAQSILAWLRGVVDGVGRPLAEMKLLLVGQGRVGKSHIRLRAARDDLAYHDGRLDPTQGIDCHVATFPLRDDHPLAQNFVRVRLWDFGGQNHLHTAHRFFLGGERCFYLLVLAADRPANGEGPDSNRLNYWLRTLARHGRTGRGERAPVAVVVTRSDAPGADQNARALDAALQAAERHGWFGARVVGVVRGMGWSSALDPVRDRDVWERHAAAGDELERVLDAHLDQVPGLGMPVPLAVHRAQEAVEAEFVGGTGRPRRAYLTADDLDRVPELGAVPPGPSAAAQRKGLQAACLGLLGSIGAAHWVGGHPEVARRNPWGVRDLVFNPEWVKRPVYDLLWRSGPSEEEPGFLSDRRLREILPARPTGSPTGGDLYDLLPFTDEDRGRVLELMRACRLVFDSPHGGGVLVPDLLEAARPADTAPAGGWHYAAEFLPERVFLRFIAGQYHAIDTRAGHCFRNRVTWRRGEQVIVLEAHFSPPGGTRPCVHIRPADAGGPPVPEAVAASIGFLLDEIYFDEGLGDVRRELWRAGDPRAAGPFVFRKHSGEGRGGAARPRFSIVFDGTDLGSGWRNTLGLSYLHTLVRRHGKLVSLRDLTAADVTAGRKGYRVRQGKVETPGADAGPVDGGPLSRRSSKSLKKSLAAAEELLVTIRERSANPERTSHEEAADDAAEKQALMDIALLTDEIERRADPGRKKQMNAVQQQLKRAVEELKERLREKGVPTDYIGHFDHCTSSEKHPYHFCYAPAVVPDWVTD